MTRMHRLRLALLAALAGIMLLGIGTAAAASFTVKITDDGIDPESITIAVGDTVTWVNETDVTQEMETSDGSMAIATIEPGESASLTFVAAGTVSYRSATDPTLTGTVQIQDGAAPTDAPTAEPVAGGSQPPTDAQAVSSTAAGITLALPLLLLVIALAGLSLTLRRRVARRG